MNTEKLREEFERSFSSKHGRNHHALANDGKRSRDCDVCAEDNRLNPKGYYLTFLNENRCYWNRDMMNDVADWWLSKLLQREKEVVEEIKLDFWGVIRRKQHTCGKNQLKLISEIAGEFASTINNKDK